MPAATDQDEPPRTRRLLRLARLPTEVEAGGTSRRPSDHDPLAVYKGDFWRLCRDGSLRRWDVSAQCWESVRRERWSKEEATFLGDIPEAHARAIAGDTIELQAGPSEVAFPAVEGCTFLGGTLDSLCVYGKYTIVFEEAGIKMCSHQAGTMELLFDQLVEVQIGGRGRIEDAGAGRASFSLNGAIDGMAPAAVINALGARTHMDTSIKIEATPGEAIFHCGRATPDELRTLLAVFLTRLRRRPRASEQNEPRPDVGRQLMDLAGLRTRELLTEEEYAVGTAAILGDDL